MSAEFQAVMDLHQPDGVEAITAPACVREECDHEDECPTSEVMICGHCFGIVEEMSPYAFEQGGPPWTPVLWPCATARAAGVPTGEAS